MITVICVGLGRGRKESQKDRMLLIFHPIPSSSLFISFYPLVSEVIFFFLFSCSTLRVICSFIPFVSSLISFSSFCFSIFFLRNFFSSPFFLLILLCITGQGSKEKRWNKVRKNHQFIFRSFDSNPSSFLTSSSFSSSPPFLILWFQPRSFDIDWVGKEKKKKSVISCFFFSLPPFLYLSNFRR